MIFISEGMVNLAIGYLASNQNFPAIVPIALRFKTTERSRTLSKVDFYWSNYCIQKFSHKTIFFASP